jgi:hypothetical protein
VWVTASPKRGVCSELLTVMRIGIAIAIRIEDRRKDYGSIAIAIPMPKDAS